MLKRIFFIKEYLKFVQNENVEIFVLDEAGIYSVNLIYFVGFGTNPFCNYSYAPVGVKAVKNYPKLHKNVTVCATISTHKTEMLRFYHGGGTKKEMFLQYFVELAKHLKSSYPNKKLVIVMDNLSAHKSSFILKVMEKYP